jgi:hypothetical protein
LATAAHAPGRQQWRATLAAFVPVVLSMLAKSAARAQYRIVQ